VLYLTRDYEGALDIILRLREQYPGASAWTAARVHVELGNWKQALEEYRLAADQHPGDAYTSLVVAFIYARSGQHERARAILDDPGTIGDAASVFWMSAAVHSALGDADSALELLERTYRARKRNVMTLAVNPAFDSLRGDPNLAEFLQHVGLPAAQGR